MVNPPSRKHPGFKIIVLRQSYFECPKWKGQLNDLVAGGRLCVKVTDWRRQKRKIVRNFKLFPQLQSNSDIHLGPSGFPELELLISNCLLDFCKHL